jgi:hypothetical protein
VTAIQDTKLLFLPMNVFSKLFNTDFMLIRLKEFTEHIDMLDLE